MNIQEKNNKGYLILRSCLYIVILSIIVYYPILQNNFLDFWDDQWVVMNKYTESGINLTNIYNILTDFYKGQYAPLNEIMYLILFSISGYTPFNFHLASLLLHIFNTCIIYIFIKKLIILSPEIEEKNYTYLPLLTAIIFVLHPFNVESVAWISASKVLVYAFFYLLAIYSYLHYLEKKNLLYYLLTLILFICSFLGKEQAVSLPICLLLLSFSIGKNLKDKYLWYELCPFFLFAFWFGITTIISQQINGEGVLTDNEIYPFGQCLILACYTFTEYFSKSLLPINLLYIYPFPIQVGESLPTWLFIYPIALFVIIFSLWKYIRMWPILFGLSFFTIHILIVLHLIPMSRYAIVADRYAYLSTIGICFIIAYYTIYLYKNLGTKSKYALISFSIIYLSSIALYSNNRSKVWHDTDSLKKEIRELLLLRKNTQQKNLLSTTN